MILFLALFFVLFATLLLASAVSTSRRRSRESDLHMWTVLADLDARDRESADTVGSEQ